MRTRTLYMTVRTICREWEVQHPSSLSLTVFVVAKCVFVPVSVYKYERLALPRHSLNMDDICYGEHV